MYHIFKAVSKGFAAVNGNSFVKQKHKETFSTIENCIFVRVVLFKCWYVGL